MTKDWCKRKNKECEKEYAALKVELYCFIANAFNELNIEPTKQEAKETDNYLNHLGDYGDTLLRLHLRRIGDKRGIDLDDIIGDKQFMELIEKMRKFYFIDEDGRCYKYNYYEDSEAIHFDGDVIVTDPCYVVKDDDWRKCNCGDNLEILGIDNYITQSTLYGDWSCTLIDCDNKNKIGEFCADAGLVSVINLEQANKYNKETIDELVKKGWCAAVVHDFVGTGQIKVKEEKYMYKGEKRIDYEAYVELTGVNKKTGEPIHYISIQTGL
jgi:hypothetical protein